MNELKSMTDWKKTSAPPWKSADFESSNGSEQSRLSVSALFAIASSRFPMPR